jgi:hypothetical protein
MNQVTPLPGDKATRSLDTARQITETINCTVSLRYVTQSDGSCFFVVGHDNHWANKMVTGISHGATETLVLFLRMD